MSLTTPTNTTPSDSATGISITPRLIASAFNSTTTVTTEGVPVDPTRRVGLSVSRDGVVFGPEIYRSIGDYGKYEDRMQWRGAGGLGRYESLMGIRIRTTSSFEFSVDGMWVDY